MRTLSAHRTLHALAYCALAVGLMMVAGRVVGDEPRQSVYLIGNSLTWDTTPRKLDGDVQWHVDCGKSLPYMYEHPENPCVKDSTLWPQALKNKQYDMISLQVHYGSTLKQDAEVIAKWIRMQPKAVIVIHSGWARSASRREEYQQQKVGEAMQHSAAYMNALLSRLRRDHPTREFRETNAYRLLQQVADDIKAKEAPFTDVGDLYRDKIHMKLDTGRYLMHNAMRRALGQPRSTKGFEKVDPKTVAYLDGVLQSLGKNAKQVQPSR